MITPSSILFAALLPSVANGFIHSRHLSHRQYITPPISTKLGSGPFFEDEFEFECPKEPEVECEIDWDKMPKDEKPNDDEIQADTPPNDDDLGCEDEDECEIDWDSMPDFQEEEAGVEPQTAKSTTFGEQAVESLSKFRTRLEMNEQIEECETDEDLCEDFCAECAGSGKMPCRFCRGTKTVVFGTAFRACIICSDGTEACGSCRGTGKIAPWASTYLEGNNN